jgi:hypothetical protein
VGSKTFWALKQYLQHQVKGLSISVGGSNLLFEHIFSWRNDQGVNEDHHDPEQG